MPALALTIFLFSLTGIPLTIGFIGKFYLFAAVIKRQFYVLALIGVLNSVVALFYYLKPIRKMFLEQPVGDEPPFRIEAWNYGLMGVLATATIALGLYWTPVIAFANRSLHFFVGVVNLFPSSQISDITADLFGVLFARLGRFFNPYGFEARADKLN